MPMRVLEIRPGGITGLASGLWRRVRRLSHRSGLGARGHYGARADDTVQVGSVTGGSWVVQGVGGRMGAKLVVDRKSVV